MNVNEVISLDKGWSVTLLLLEKHDAFVIMRKRKDEGADDNYQLYYIKSLIHLTSKGPLSHRYDFLYHRN
jgi:hypothetical protein